MAVLGIAAIRHDPVMLLAHLLRHTKHSITSVESSSWSSQSRTKTCITIILHIHVMP